MRGAAPLDYGSPYVNQAASFATDHGCTAVTHSVTTDDAL